MSVDTRFFAACTGLTVTASSQEPPPLSTWHHFTRRYHGHRKGFPPMGIILTRPTFTQQAPLIPTL